MTTVRSSCGKSRLHGDSVTLVLSHLRLSCSLRRPLRSITMAAQAKDRQFLAVIGDEDSVTGLLLAGVGHVTDPPDSQRNFLVVDSKTETSTIEKAFQNFTQERKDIAIVLINQHVAERIRHSVDSFADPFPAVLEIPSKDHPYDPEKDSVLKRVRRLFGE